MRNIVFLLFLMMVASSHAAMQNLNVPSGTNAVFATSTNTVDGVPVSLPDGVAAVRIYVEFTGTTATTNGNYNVFFKTGRYRVASSNFWDVATNSNIKISVPTVGLTNTGSLWFNLTGVQSIRVGREENLSQGIATNLTYTIVIPSPERP